MMWSLKDDYIKSCTQVSYINYGTVPTISLSSQVESSAPRPFDPFTFYLVLSDAIVDLRSCTLWVGPLGVFCSCPVKGLPSPGCTRSPFSHLTHGPMHILCPLQPSRVHSTPHTTRSP